ncbi:MAG: ATP-binding cassette domain-containing protein [Saccharofermentans sp.]|nr:ATP-binding cassette domain-containing protein [Saccharofermentans sp.]
MEMNSVEFDLNFRYSNEEKCTLQDVKGEIMRGNCICVCGESGCGKSTLLRCINHLVPEFYEGELTGWVYIGGEDISELSIGEVSTKVSSVFQDPRSQFFTVNSTTEVAFGLENSGVAHEEIVRRTDEIFRVFGLEKLKDRPVHMMSSGERQMIAILSALATGTDLILLDEPTANLDAAAIAQLSDLLVRIKETGKTLIINEHRLYFLRDIADEYWYVNNGEIRGRYQASEFLALSGEDLEVMGLRTTSLDLITLDGEYDPAVKVSDTLEISSVSYGYDRSNVILKDISYKCGTGSVTGIIGSNGSGKTTLGKCICGLMKLTGGSIYLNGDRADTERLISSSMFIMQEAEFQFFSNTVINEIKGTSKSEAVSDDEIERVLKMMNLWECRNRHPFSLSGGQMQKLVLVLAYFSNKPVLVLDEPSAGLDHRSLISCADLIREMAQTRIVFVITHDIELISKVCTDCISVRQGVVDRHFILKDDHEFEALKSYMEHEFSIKDNARDIPGSTKASGADPRVCLFYLTAALIMCFMSNAAIQAAIMTGILVIAILNSKYKKAVLYAASFAVLVSVPYLTTAFVPNILSNFFARFIPVGFAADLLFSEDGASRLLAALRKMHVPESVIMICSVMFRFFPVICNDMRISMQSVKTRSFFPKLRDKIRNIPSYIEILIVPMMFRVIRIAEFLSASAETRGISLRCRKDSYIECRMKVSDYILISILPVLITAYQLIT